MRKRKYSIAQFMHLVLALSFVPTSLEDRLAIYGLHLKVAVAQYPPFSSINQRDNGTFYYVGFNIEVIDWLARALNLKVTYVNEVPSEVLKHGQTGAIINQLLNKEADIAAYLLYPTMDRVKLMDFTTIIGVAEFVLMVPYPEYQSEIHRLSAPLQPFSTAVWLSLAFSTAISIFFMSLITTYCRRINDGDKHPASLILNLNRNSFLIFSTILNHGYRFSLPVVVRFVSIRVFLGFWCLMMLILINYYSSNLTSHMTVIKLTPVINSLEELATSKKVKLTIEINSALANRLMDSTYGTYKVLGDTLRENPHLLVHRATEVVDNVLKRDAAYFQDSNYCKFLIAMDTKKNGGKCRLTQSNPISAGYSHFSSYGLTKNKPYNDIINKELLYLWQSGLMSLWKKIYTPNIDKCLVQQQQRHSIDSSKPLSLRDFSGAFLLLGLGLSLALCICLLENILLKMHKRAVLHAGHICDNNSLK